MRVEIEEPTSSASEVPKVAGRQLDTDRRVLASFGVVVVFLVVLLFAIRPDEATTSAVTPRSRPTTVPTMTSSVPGLVADVRSETSVISIEETIGAAGLSELVADGLLFLGLGFSDRDGSPVILRSVDARTWEEVETAVRGIPHVARDEGFRNFTSLIKTEQGFALLLLDTGYLFAEAAGNQAQTTRVIRLISERGATWAVDPSFPTIEVEGIPSIFGHDELHFGYVDSVRGRNLELRQLPEENLIDGEGFEDSSCAAALVEMRGAAKRSILVGRDGDPVVVGRLGTPTGVPVLLPGGEVAVLVAQPPDDGVSERCHGLIDGPAIEPAIERWVEGRRVARFTIPADIAAADLFDAGAPGVAHADGLRLSLGGTLWDVSLVDGSWTRASDLQNPDVGRSLSLQGNDERVLEPSIIYNHDDVVLVRHGGEPLVIRLSP